jgi:flagellar motor protein MotB
LDQKLNAYLSGTLSGDKAIEMVDNVGLGMMRAASVVRALQEMPELQRSAFIFLAMSAGQTIGPDDRPIGPDSGSPTGDEKRRRVEIRLRRSLYEP